MAFFFSSVCVCVCFLLFVSPSCVFFGLSENFVLLLFLFLFVSFCFFAWFQLLFLFFFSGSLKSTTKQWSSLFTYLLRHPRGSQRRKGNLFNCLDTLSTTLAGWLLGFSFWPEMLCVLFISLSMTTSCLRVSHAPSDYFGPCGGQLRFEPPFWLFLEEWFAFVFSPSLSSFPRSSASSFV